MTLGTGIAIAGVWVFAGLLCHSKNTSGDGVLLAIFVAVTTTFFLML